MAGLDDGRFAAAGLDAGDRAAMRGKSDSIDSISVARAALREGLDELPAAQLIVSVALGCATG